MKFCAFCEKGLKGKKSNFYNLCYECRNTKQGKEHINNPEKNLERKRKSIWFMEFKDKNESS